jgi:hypothetical protein
MNLETLVDDRLINFCLSKQIIVVLGYTKTGKITIAKKLSKETQYPLLISDDYVKISNPIDALYILMEDIKEHQRNNQPFIVEGILCFRLLRKGAKLNSFNPDVIIKTQCNDETIQYFYNKDGESNKVNRALSFNKGLNTIWEEYLNLIYHYPHNIKPTYIELNTSII